jgi:predicted HicB family RNase H-like nuclease
MREEYDFASGQRGKFHRAELRLVPPVHLEPDVLAFLAERARDKGMSLNALVNQLLEKDIELIKLGT